MRVIGVNEKEAISREETGTYTYFVRKDITWKICVNIYEYFEERYFLSSSELLIIPLDLSGLSPQRNFLSKR